MSPSCLFFQSPTEIFEIKFTVICLNCAQLMSPGNVKEACVGENRQRGSCGGPRAGCQSERPGKCPKGLPRAAQSLQVADRTLQKYSI